MKRRHGWSTRRANVDDQQVAFDQRRGRRAKKILRHFEFSGKVAFPVDLPGLQFEAVQLALGAICVYAIAVDHRAGAWSVIVAVPILELRGVAEIPILLSGFGMQTLDLLPVALAVKVNQPV